MLPIIQQWISKNRPFKKLKALRGIVVHWTANLNKGADAVANARYFNSDQTFTDKQGNKRKTSASAHYVVDDHQIVQCIPDDEVGYHVGAKVYKDMVYQKLGVPLGDSPNNYTIGIEMCVNSDGDFNITRQNTIELILVLLKKWNLNTSHLYRHFDITGKDCPKMMLDDSIWKAFLGEIDQAIQNTNSKIKVSATVLFVRSGPGKEYSVKRQLVRGSIVNKLHTQGNWIEISPNEWINAGYVVPVS